jgi:hypothetical protein
MTREKEQYSEQIKTLKDTVGKGEEKMKLLLCDANKHNVESELFRKAKTEWEKKHDALQLKLQETMSDNVLLQEKTRELEKKKEIELDNTVKELTGKWKNATASSYEQQLLIEQLTAELESAKRTRQNLEDDISKMQMENKHLAKDNDKLQRDAKSAVAQTEGSIQALEKKLDDIQQQNLML